MSPVGAQWPRGGEGVWEEGEGWYQQGKTSQENVKPE